MNVETLFSLSKVVPVVTIDDTLDAFKIAEILLNANIKILEVTLRSHNALLIIQQLVEKFPELTIGAGTIVNDDQFHMAVGHLAKFIVSPGLTMDLNRVASQYIIPFIPGVLTPSEVMNAINLNYEYLKFYPAGYFNGLEILKSYSVIFPEIKFFPTGGVNLNNIRDYLSLPNVVAVGSSFIINEYDIRNKNFTKINELVGTIKDYV